jgi:N6-adenosine-specific RNA methylase IME4
VTTLMPGHAPLKFHPLANLFPMLSDKELDELADDIRANGQVETVKLHRGMVLDGRNRYTACQRKALPVRTEIFEGTDREALNFVCSKNLNRRHLSENDRLRIAANMQKLKLGANQYSVRAGAPIGQTASLFEETPHPQQGDEAPPSQAERADLLKVSKRSLQRADVLYSEKGAPELQQAFESGKIAVSTAAEIAEALPAEEQKQVAQLSEAEILAKAKEIRKDKNDKRRAERVEKLKQQAEAVSPLPTARRFPIIYFDPATKFAAGDSDRSTENHYLTMTEEDLAALPIADLATEDSAIFMWTTVAWLFKSLRLLERWGFDYKSAAFWDKVDFGLGFWWRDQVEILLVATRGKMVAPENGSVLGPNLYREKKGRHSAKPTYFRDLIGNVPEYRDLPKVELFARVDEPLPDGWYAWGAQANVPKQQSLSIDDEDEAA